MSQKHKNKKLFFVYKTTCIVNGKQYIGVHSTFDLNDGYIGNGIYRQKDATGRSLTYFKAAVNKHGYGNFTRDIIKFFSNIEEAFLLESELVTEEWILSKNNYNIALGGKRGYGIHKFKRRPRIKTTVSRLGLCTIWKIRKEYQNHGVIQRIEKSFKIARKTVKEIIKNYPPPSKRTYKAKSPELKEYIFTNVSSFSRFCGIPESGIMACIKKSQYHYKNWQFSSINEDYSKKVINTYKIISPNNEIFETESLFDFFKNHNLNTNSLRMAYECIKGSRKTYKDWKFTLNAPKPTSK